MGKIQKISKSSRERLELSKERLLFTVACIDEVLDASDSQANVARKLGLTQQEFYHRMQTNFSREVRMVPFGPGRLEWLLIHAEEPSGRILRKVFGVRDHEYVDFPEYDEDVFWDEYIASLGDERDIEILKLCHGSREDDTSRSFTEVGRLMGLTGSRIAQIMQKNYRRLRRKSRLEILFPFQKDVLDEVMCECTELKARNRKNLAAIIGLRRECKGLERVTDVIDECLSTLEDMGFTYEGDPFIEEWQHVPIDELPPELALSVRPYNCLKRSGIRTLGDLRDRIKSKSDLTAINGMGAKSAAEVMNLMRLYGIPISED